MLTAGDDDGYGDGYGDGEVQQGGRRRRGPGSFDFDDHFGHVVIILWLKQGFRIRRLATYLHNLFSFNRGFVGKDKDWTLARTVLDKIRAVHDENRQLVMPVTFLFLVTLYTIAPFLSRVL